jgi:hypothetical protein
METACSSRPMVFMIFLTVAFAAFCLCCSPGEKVERIRESGVEVVLNHLEPYRPKNEPATFDLETVLAIDLEREDLAAKVMGSAGEFDVDAEGNIYVIAFKNIKNFVYRFNPRGGLLNSFGAFGQGPGELEWPFLDDVSDSGDIAFTDRMRKYIVFDKNGKVLKEFRPGFGFSYVFPLENGNFVLERSKYEERSSKDSPWPHCLSLCDPSFKEIKELDRHMSSLDNSRLVPFFMWRVSGDRIYIANEERGYEILDFDLDGSLRRKIRKEYRPVVATEEIKKAVLGPGYGQTGISQERYFPKPMPPLSSFFTDDEGRLFVMTYEAGDRPGEYFCDIFNADGVFIGRKSLDTPWASLYGGPKYVMAKKGLLYYNREKESGYNELVIRKIIWKK